MKQSIHTFFTEKMRPYSKKINVIGLNAMVCIEDIDSGERFMIYLVTPDDMDGCGIKLSISSPLGSILNGRTEGSKVDWNAPSRLRRLKVRSVEWGKLSTK